MPGLQLSEFWTAVLALALNVGAYNAEVFIGVAAVYLLLTTTFTQFSAALERQLVRHRRH